MALHAGDNLSADVGLRGDERRMRMSASDQRELLPELIRRLPEADIPFPGVRAWLSQGPDHQIGFFDIEAGAHVPEHSHKAQWGIVIEGEMELTVGGETRTYGRGGSYYIPEGVVHAAVFKRRTAVLDLFADRDRYKAKG